MTCGKEKSYRCKNPDWDAKVAESNRQVDAPNNLHRELLFNHKRIRVITYPDCSGRFLAGNGEREM